MKTKLNFLMVLALLVMLVGGTASSAKAEGVLTIGPDPLPDAVYATPYSQQLTASGGDGSYTFSLVSGTLPWSLTLSSDGVLSGTSIYGGADSAPGNYPITIGVTDGSGATGSTDYTFVVDKDTPTVTVHSLDPSVYPIYWGDTFNIWVDGILDPSGSMAFGTVAYAIDGTAVPGCQAVTYNISNILAGCQNVSMDLALGVHTLTAIYTPSGIEANYYNTASGTGTLTVLAGSHSISGYLFSDNDQDGLWDDGDSWLDDSWTVNLDQGCNGSVDQTTTTSVDTGLYTFSNLPGGDCYRISEVVKPGWQQTTTLADIMLSRDVYPFNIGNYYPTITVSPADLPAGSVGVAYSQQLTAGGGTGPYTFSVTDGTLPDGLALSADGTLSGSPTTPGFYSFTVQAEDASQVVGTRDYHQNIKTDGSFTLTSSLNPSLQGQEVTFTLSATGDAAMPPYGPVPPVGMVTFQDNGVAIAGCSGVYLNLAVDENGDPTGVGDYPAVCTTSALAAGLHEITADYTDLPILYNDATISLQGGQTVTNYESMTFSPANLPDGSLGAAYNQTITVSGGLPPYTFQNGSEQWLPAGLTLDTSSGSIIISGTPTEAGQVMLDVYVYDQTGQHIEIEPMFWIKTDPSLTLTSSLNPSLQGEEVTFSLGSTATVVSWPVAPWGQVTFYADGAAIPGCDGLWLDHNGDTGDVAPNPVTCTTSTLAAGSHAITATLTSFYGPYNDSTATLAGGQRVNTNVPQYVSVGFTAPLDLGGILNTAKAGQMIPLKWRLLDGSGNPVLNLDPASVTMTVSPYTCPSGAATDAIETYASGTSLLQNLGNGYYQLNWKTEKTYVNTCKQITLKIGDWTGDGFAVLFQFKK